MIAFWVLSGAGALTFLWGLASGDPRHVWSIDLVNLVFWAARAATGPARTRR